MKYDLIFLDRDGTLNPDPGYISSLDDFEFYPFTIDALKQLDGQSFIIITNQSGVARGIIDEGNLEEIHQYIRKMFSENHINLKAIYLCTDHPDRPTERRKPGPGMFREAARDFNLDLSRCLVIGDAESDILAGQNLSMDTMLVLTGKGKETLPGLTVKPTFVAENLLEGVKLLER